MSNKPTISSTAIGIYLSCPKRYWFRYKAGIEEELSEIAKAGRKVHSIIEEYDDLLLAIEEVDRSEEIAFKYKEAAKAALEYVFSLEEFDKENSLIEYEFDIDFSRFRLKGVFDVVVLDDKRSPLYIIDWKFSMSKYVTEDRYRLQATVYNLAFRSLFGKDPFQVSFINIHKRTSIKFYPKDLIFYEKVLTSEIIPAIISSEDYPRYGVFNGNCRFCGYKDECIPAGRISLLGNFASG